MQLSRTQALFSKLMLDRPDKTSKPDPALKALFTCNENVLPMRLQIYQNNVVGSLARAMQLTYPLIVILTGESFAENVMRSFVRENPPREACLARYGEGFDKYIESYEPARSLPYLADIARLEWAMNESFYARDDSALDPSDLQNVPGSELADITLSLRSSVRLMESRWPLPAIRAFCLQENRDESQTLDLDQGGCKVMIYRPFLSAEIELLDPAEYDFLKDVKDGRPLGDILESVLQTHPDFDFQAFLQKHLRLETFSSIQANT
ncbi:MAG: putative DNA-binding domain-containing protein [Candidatus Dadabacteria bacterium]|nr:putative DNA-binding domain-containing protein [Candidatus Dadabacteria bacterium]